MATITGNLLEHYDTALFALLAPYLAPLFFNTKNPVTALILTYGMMPLGLLSKPLGAFFFGWIGDRRSRKYAFCLSLAGVAGTTTIMGCLPTYAMAGVWAPCLLALTKILQGFFAAGESAGGALILLERQSSRVRGWLSGLYNVSSILGMALASLFVMLMDLHLAMSLHWRWLFLAGSLTAWIILWIRRDLPEASPTLPSSQRAVVPPPFLLLSFLTLLLANGFSHVIYHFAFTLMNGYIPLATSFSQADTLQANTYLLLLDAVLLPIFGAIASYWNRHSMMMQLSSFSIALLSTPLCMLIDYDISFGFILWIRICLVTLGVAFAAPYYAWAIESLPFRHRYLSLAVAGALGSQLIGAPTSAIGIWLYQMTHRSWSLGLYLSCLSLITSIVLLAHARLVSNRVNTAVLDTNII
jgi:MFS family permease